MNDRALKHHPTLRYHNVLSALCRPLKWLGVTFFAYTAVDKSGNAFCLGSKADYAEAYLKRRQFNNDFHHFQPKQGKEFHYRFWDFAHLGKHQQKLYQMAAEFDQSHTLTISRYDENYAHYYHFSGKINDVGINQRYLDKLDMLHLFIDHFDDCLEDIPEMSSIYQYPNHLRNAATNQSTEVGIVDMDPARLSLPTVGKNQIRFKNLSQYYLTANERRCLYWLHRGKSADMIADILGVTRKSVERYIASIKDKYSCYTLYQLGGHIAESGLAQFL